MIGEQFAVLLRDRLNSFHDGGIESIQYIGVPREILGEVVGLVGNEFRQFRLRQHRVIERIRHVDPEMRIRVTAVFGE